MSLKKAELQYLDIYGNAVAATLTIKSVVFDYENLRVDVIYKSLPTDADRAKIAAPQYFSQSIQMDLTDPADLSMVLGASARVWEIAKNHEFIQVPEYDNKTETIVIRRKSIADLGEIVEAK